MANAHKIFGANSIYFDVKQRVKSVAKTKITDGLLLDLNNNMFWLVEIELSKHDPDMHIAPQINGFIRALQKQETLSEITNIVYNSLKNDKSKLALAKKALGDEEVYLSIDRMLRERCGILIIIDEITPEIEEILPDFVMKKNTKIIKFRTYEKDSN